LAPSEEEAAALLDATAVQNPEAVLPPEAQPEAAMSEEDMAALDQLAGELDAAGITPEQLMEAQAEIEAIKAETGASDEDIIQALQEEAGAEGGMDAPAAPEVPAEPVIPEAAMPKEASARKSLLEVLAKLNAAK
jgi:hypothetical protein